MNIGFVCFSYASGIECRHSESTPGRFRELRPTLVWRCLPKAEPRMGSAGVRTPFVHRCSESQANRKAHRTAAIDSGDLDVILLRFYRRQNCVLAGQHYKDRFFGRKALHLPPRHGDLTEDIAFECQRFFIFLYDRTRDSVAVLKIT